MGIEGFLSTGFTLWIREKSQQDVDDVGFKRKWNIHGVISGVMTYNPLVI